MKNDDEVDDGDSMAAYGEGDTGNVAFSVTLQLNTTSKNYHQSSRKCRIHSIAILIRYFN